MAGRGIPHRSYTPRPVPMQDLEENRHSSQPSPPPTDAESHTPRAPAVVPITTPALAVARQDNVVNVERSRSSPCKDVTVTLKMGATQQTDAHPGCNVGLSVPRRVQGGSDGKTNSTLQPVTPSQESQVKHAIDVPHCHASAHNENTYNCQSRQEIKPLAESQKGNIIAHSAGKQKTENAKDSKLSKNCFPQHGVNRTLVMEDGVYPFQPSPQSGDARSNQCSQIMNTPSVNILSLAGSSSVTAKEKSNVLPSNSKSAHSDLANVNSTVDSGTVTKHVPPVLSENVCANENAAPRHYVRAMNFASPPGKPSQK